MKNSVFEKLAKKYQGQYVPGGIGYSECVHFEKEGLTIVVDIGTRLRADGNSGVHYDDGDYDFELINTYTDNNKDEGYSRIRGAYKNINGFYCTIYRQGGVFQNIGKMLGMQDIEIGIEDFDKKYILQSNKENLLQNILFDQKIRNRILMHPKMIFKVKTENRFLGSFHPEGVDELYYEESKKLGFEELDSIVVLFSLFYQKLVDLKITEKNI